MPPSEQDWLGNLQGPVRCENGDPFLRTTGNLRTVTEREATREALGDIALWATAQVGRTPGAGFAHFGL